MDYHWKYKAFGLNILSEFEIPELPHCTFSDPDVTISYGNNPKNLQHPTGSGVLFQAGKNDFLFRLNTVGAFRVKDGNKIIVERLNNSSDSELNLFLLGSAFGALLHQNNILPMHASAIADDSHAYLICGNSGVGKSSLAANMINRAYKLVSDDITAINFKDNVPYAVPGIPHIKLWKDILSSMEENLELLPKVRPSLEKYRKSAIQQSISRNIPVKGIFILKSVNEEGFKQEKHSGIHKLNLIKEHVYRPRFAEGMDSSAHLMKKVISLSKCKSVFEIQRPSSPILLNELSDLLENSIKLISKSESNV